MINIRAKNNLKGEKNLKKNILGNYLKNLREQHGVSQLVLSEQIDTSSAFITYLEGGSRLPSENTLKKYAEFFKVDFEHLKDLLEKQKLLNKQSENEPVTSILPEPIQKLVETLLKVDEPLREKLVTSFMEQVNDHLIKMTPNYTLTDLRSKCQKVLAFAHKHENPVILEGFLKLQEDNTIYFKLTRFEDTISLQVLQTNRSAVDYFEKWLGPNVFSYLCKVQVPQVLELQKGVSFCWFAPSTTIQKQYKYLLQQNLDINSVLLNSSQLAWFIEQNYDALEEDAL